MQSTYLITAKSYSEKQVGIIFFVFGMSQFLFQAPAGYLMDYSDKKVFLLGGSSIATTLLTLATAVFAKDNGGNFGIMIFFKILQGAFTALIPPGLNSITQGIVGPTGMTLQVSHNEMMHHLGTAIFVVLASLVAFAIYPHVEFLFVVSPVACIGLVYHLARIRSTDIDHQAARGFSVNRNSSIYDSYSFDEESLKYLPSFNLGFAKSISFDANHSGRRNRLLEANTPLQIVKDSTILVFVIICFTFHLSNGTILPLVMQTLAIGNGRAGLLMSGFSIAVAQIFMEFSAEMCGKYADEHGRKKIFIVGLLSVPARCAILTCALTNEDQISWILLHIIILSTQVLDGIGAGIFGTMYVLVTSDVSFGTGRFSLTLGLTTAAVSIGATISGYLGQALAADIGYSETFLVMGCISMIPALAYHFFMPETAPEKQRSSLSTISSFYANHRNDHIEFNKEDVEEKTLDESIDEYDLL